MRSYGLFSPKRAKALLSVNVKAVYWVLVIINISFNIWFIVNYVHWKKCLSIGKEGAFAALLDNLYIHTQSKTLAESG